MTTFAVQRWDILGQRFPYSSGICLDNVCRTVVEHAGHRLPYSCGVCRDNVCRTMVEYAGTTFAVQLWNMPGQRLSYSCGTCRSNVCRTVVKYAGTTFAVQWWNMPGQRLPWILLREQTVAHRTSVFLGSEEDGEGRVKLLLKPGTQSVTSSVHFFFNCWATQSPHLQSELTFSFDISLFAAV